MDHGGRLVVLCGVGWAEVLLAVLCFLVLHYKPFITWPLLRDLPALLINLPRIQDWTADVHGAVGGTFTARGPILTGMRLVLTCDPCNVEYILKTRFSNFPKGPDFQDIFRELMGDGIFNTDGDEWQAQRRTANAHVRSKAFRTFFEKKSRELAFINLVPILGRAAEEGAAIDLQDLIMRYTVDATCAALFGEAIGYLAPELPLVPFAQAADEVMEAVVVRHVLPHMWWKLMRLLGLGMESRLAKGVRTMDEFVARQVVSARGRGSGGGDLLSIFATGDVSGTDNKYLRDVAVNFLIAGRDTTGAALAWFFWLVSRHPEVEAKILAELKEKGTKDLSELHYLHAALSETLRLYPSLPLDHKGVREKDVLPDGTTVEPGTVIVYSIYAMGRMEWIWGEDCLRFKPERWVGEDGKLRAESGFKFLAFNGGPRTCLGKEVAFVQMKCAAAAVLSSFRLEVVAGHRVSMKPSVILVMKDGLKMRVRERLPGVAGKPIFRRV
ncbi:cytochrome P450 86B1 [Amborella trichopoda]|uniref:cytochrome P450 86B1 n=1 Tax=Amborella trichopoda TaxID=13333 RepID=UPI0005D3F131|nr:cytochrome P450 86B1 [Amborella trichopoda]|eukprot:XP_011628322.1 cytochrome P450 86B1 [Amborella trichopoda]